MHSKTMPSFTLLAALLLAPLTALHAAEPAKPNILSILADDKYYNGEPKPQKPWENAAIIGISGST
jgi:hypothetical protein